ncbi:MAG: TetR/AcrR family transcriptional regulator [Burkholderiales bacterium]|nr:TetR/AcrR family transcriptional regulator [Burkholderiales bacterium]
MPQIKKPEVERAILRSAFALFSRDGYAATTLPQIAKGAGVSPGTVYVYFNSKLAVLYALYDPWLRQRITNLEQRLARIADPRRRLRTLIGALWGEIPREHNGFANNIMQATSTVGPEERYDPHLLTWVEERVAAMIRDALPPARRRLLGTPLLSHILMMAFDGFVIGHHLRPGRPCSDRTVELMCRLILGEPARAPRNAAPRRGAQLTSRPPKSK